AGATGTCISVNMINYMKYSAGAVLCQLDSDAYEEELKEINERIEAAQEALDAELAKLEKYHGVAPISGTVMGCSFVEGEETVVGTSSITISDTSVIYLEAQIDEMDVSKVSIGMPVEVSQYDENIYQGTVVSISSEGKFEGGYSYFPAMIELPNDGRLMVGMYCTFSFVSSQVDDCVIAPVQSVKYTEQGTCLFVKADERPESAIDLGEGIVPEGFFAVPVEVGLSDDTGVEIKSGVGEGVEVFTSMLVNQGNSWQDQAGGGVKVAIG
ncbi:MAG: efflux RND transporter periplasmic adaptor subunit, partial [Oscillospiraceae bacterium]